MDHVGIDIGGRESQVCVRNSAGEIVEEIRRKTGSLAAVLAGRARSRVIVETCTEAFRIADTAIARGHEVRVVPATLVRSLGVGQRGLKNDERDARLLSEASGRIDLPSVHIPSTTSREWKALSTSREALVRARTQLISTIRSYVRSRRSSVLRATPESLPPNVRAALLETEAGLAERELNQRISEITNPRTRLLETIPSIGVLSSRTIVAALDDAKRFENRKAVAKYGALTPTIYQSGETVQLGKINRDGRQEVRRVLLQCAHLLTRMKSPSARPLRLFFERIAKRQGKKKALVALARKLLTVSYGVLKSELPYDPTKLLPQAG